MRFKEFLKEENLYSLDLASEKDSKSLVNSDEYKSRGVRSRFVSFMDTEVDVPKKKPFKKRFRI